VKKLCALAEKLILTITIFDFGIVLASLILKTPCRTFINRLLQTKSPLLSSVLTARGERQDQMLKPCIARSTPTRCLSARFPASPRCRFPHRRSPSAEGSAPFCKPVMVAHSLLVELAMPTLGWRRPSGLHHRLPQRAALAAEVGIDEINPRARIP